MAPGPHDAVVRGGGAPAVSTPSPGTDHDGAVELPRRPSMRHPPLAFAHRGGRAHAPENTLEAFELALTLGATGLESDAWLTADGDVALIHDGSVRRGVRRRAVRGLRRAELPAHVPTLDDLYDRCGTTPHVSIDLKDDEVAPAILRVANERGALDRLWLCHPRWEALAELRRDWPTVGLVHSTRLTSMSDGPERAAATLAAEGIDAVNLPASEWTGGLTTLFHRFEVEAFGWDANVERLATRLAGVGCDAIYGDRVDLLVDAIERLAGPLRPDPPG